MKTEIYFQALEEFTIEQVGQAGMTLIKTRPYPSFPKPGEIAKVILDGQKPKALEAWGMVMARLGCGEQPEDPRIRSAIKRLGGWAWLQSRSYDELRWIEKRFVDHLQEISESDPVELTISSGMKELSEKITGIME